ncbi:hypothetical protein U5801_25350, partial [Lamprobacter modestohalophilus]|uniref:hypothetical protein n=1 Tax=Lamprobacter modestohalophilus TaxID=1064514 RepID=UPI002ADEEA9C
MIRFLACSLLAFLTFTATSAGAAQWPAAVMAKVSELKSSCAEVGGKLINPKQAILEADLNQDGRPDYVIDQSALNCQGAASLFSGSGGSHVDVFVGSPGSHVALPDL